MCSNMSFTHFRQLSFEIIQRCLFGHVSGVCWLLFDCFYSYINQWLVVYLVVFSLGYLTKIRLIVSN
jgi:hypothetical protein